MLIDIALCENLFHTAPGTAFADIIIAGHRETWPIRSKRFRAFLRHCDYHATGEAASAPEVRSALDLLEARAQFDGPERLVHIRTAEHEGHIYLDLADEHWRAVDIGSEGWRAIERPPVRFRRPPGMSAARRYSSSLSRRTTSLSVPRTQLLHVAAVAAVFPAPSHHHGRARGPREFAT
jgi:hypothetical protein